MALQTDGAATRAGARWNVRRGLLLALVVALLLGAAYGLGYRVNVQTRSVPVPTAQATPEEVVLAYVAAYDHRDLATMRAIYPSGAEGVSRFRAMGTMNDVRIVQRRAADDADLNGTFPKPGYSYSRVEVSLELSGLTGSDFAYEAGPNGWTYALERADSTRPWTITDQGNG